MYVYIYIVAPKKIDMYSLNKIMGITFPHLSVTIYVYIYIYMYYAVCVIIYAYIYYQYIDSSTLNITHEGSGNCPISRIPASCKVYVYVNLLQGIPSGNLT